MKAQREYDDWDDRSEYVKNTKKKMKRRDEDKTHHRKNKRDHFDDYLNDSDDEFYY